MEKKGRWKRRLLGLLALTVMTVLLCGMSVEAASKKTVSMKKKSGNFTYVGTCGDKKTVYHKFTLGKPSYVLVTGAESLKYTGSMIGMDVTLCDKKKKALDQAQYVKLKDTVDNSIFAQYALTKGTYYVKVSKVGNYGLMVATTTKVDKLAITDPGGKSKSKAKTINSGKSICGIIAAGEAAGKADWFKFKVTKSKVLNFNLYAEGTSKVNFTLYGPSYKKGINMADLLNRQTALQTVEKNSWGGTIGTLKVKPGTYYIRVSRSSGYRKKAYSAVYSLKWK